MRKESYPLLSGFHEISGYFFPESILSSTVRIKRILTHYKKGCGLYKFSCGFVLILPEKTYSDTQKTPGIPIIHTGSFYSQIVPPKYLLKGFELSSNSLLLVINGKIEVFLLSSENAFPPSKLVDISNFKILQNCFPLGEIPDPPPSLAYPIKKSINSILGETTPEPTKEQIKMISDIRDMVEKGEYINTGGEKFLQKGFGFIGGIVGFFFGKSGKNNIDANRNCGYYPDSELQNGTDLKTKLLSLLMKNPLIWHLLAGKHAKYLREMIDMFEKGDLTTALRYGISLNNAQNLTSRLGPLRMQPRQDLSFTEISNNGGSAGIEDDTFELLKKLYRDAFKRLDRDGRFEEAAFVLAELISDHERAVSYLESKEMLKKAAELAESKELSPGIIIRQWFLCKEIDRAISIAKKTGSFSDAVLHLERTHRDKAKDLRVIWANHLEKSGDFSKAVDVIWPVEDKQDLALEWIEKSIGTGGASGAIMLAKRLELVESKREDTKKRVFKLLQSMDVEDFNAKSAFAKMFCRIKENEYTKLIGRYTFRTVLRERTNGLNYLNKHDLNKLLIKSKDKVLYEDYKRIDLSFFTKDNRNKVYDRDEPLIHTFSKKGVVKIYDICLLHRGRFLVALGEAGVKIVNSKLKTIAHFNVPAHSLVISDNRNRAIALAKRGDIFRISKISVNERKSSFWHETALSQFAKTYNGGYWFVVSNNERLSAIDVHSEKFRAIWSVNDIGDIGNIARSQTSLALFTTGHATEKFVYETDCGITLRQRQTISIEPSAITSISPGGSLGNFYYQEENIRLICEFKLQGFEELKEIDYFDGLSGFPDFNENYIAIPLKTDYGSDIVIFSAHPNIAGKILSIIKIEMCDEPVIRLYKDKVLIADNNGRIILIDLEFSEIIHSFEI